MILVLGMNSLIPRLMLEAKPLVSVWFQIKFVLFFFWWRGVNRSIPEQLPFLQRIGGKQQQTQTTCAITCGTRTATTLWEAIVFITIPPS